MSPTTTSKDEPLVELRDVWRRYRLRHGGHSATLRATVALGRQGLRRDWFWALRGVNLAVRCGRATAVIGANGAGKSTLLRLAGGIGRPDRGSVRVRGRVGAMLDLGREFHPDLTGRQNAELAAVVAGLSRRQFRDRYEAIVDFAGLHDFADEPLHAYSDGMRARLAFSVLAHVEPDVLLIDEVLAVGDAAFQRRSVEHIDALREAGAAVLFVSHDLSLVRRVCDEAIWLDGGSIRAVGDAAAVVHDYLASAADGTVAPGAEGAGPVGPVGLRDAWGAPASTLRTGDGLRVAWQVEADPGSAPRNVSLVLRRHGDDTVAVDTSTPLTGDAEVFEVVFERLDMAPGRYDVVVAVLDRGWSRILGESRSSIDVRGEGSDRAVLAPPHEWFRRPG